MAPAASANFAEVQRLGQGDHGIDWVGCPALAEALTTAARATKWRRQPGGRGHGSVAPGGGGKTVGNLGRHLAEATVNLLARDLNGHINQWEDS